MKKQKINILISILLASNLLFGENIELNKDYYEIEVAEGKMVVIDFPFKITDHQFLGYENSLKGNIKDKSLYLKIDNGIADVAIWGAEKPILVTLKATKNGKRRMSFYDNPNNIKNLKEEYREWNHDIKVTEQIEMYSKKNRIAGFESEVLNIEFNIDGELTVKKLERLKNSSNYAFEKLLIKNNSNTVVDLFTKKDFYFTKRDDYVIDAVSFDNRYLLPNQETFCYLGLEKR